MSSDGGGMRLAERLSGCNRALRGVRSLTTESKEVPGGLAAPHVLSPQRFLGTISRMRPLACRIDPTACRSIGGAL